MTARAYDVGFEVSCVTTPLIVFTNKEDGLWNTTSKVSAEDIDHLKARVELFRFTHQFVSPGDRPDGDSVPECGHHLAKWIVEACGKYDASQVLNPAPLLPVDARSDESAVVNLGSWLDLARPPKRVRVAMVAEIVGLGALNVQELTQEDWERLPSWSCLRPLERRRLLSMVANGTPV